eukprot:352307-Chlamydomonas_euryale.AAC.4
MHACLRCGMHAARHGRQKPQRRWLFQKWQHRRKARQRSRASLIMRSSSRLGWPAKPVHTQGMLTHSTLVTTSAPTSALGHIWAVSSSVANSS